MFDRELLPAYPRGVSSLFTLEQANALLPRLREILLALQEAVSELQAAQANVAALLERIRRNGRHSPVDPYPREQALERRIRVLVTEIQEIGCELKDVRLGLIDFPSRRDGQPIYLCWKLDETEVAYWHPIDTGFADRRLL